MGEKNERGFSLELDMTLIKNICIKWNMNLWTSYNMCQNLAMTNRANASKISPKTRSFSAQV